MKRISLALIVLASLLSIISCDDWDKQRKQLIQEKLGDIQKGDLIQLDDDNYLLVVLVTPDTIRIKDHTYADRTDVSLYLHRVKRVVKMPDLDNEWIKITEQQFLN